MPSPDKPREQAVDILRQAEAGIFADTLLDRARPFFDQRDNAFILELVYGVLRNREKLDWLLDRFSKEPVASTDDWTRNILRLGAYQLLFLDKVPASAAVNTSTELAKTHGKKSGYVNGLLRNLERKKNAIPPLKLDDPVKQLAILHSHPEWLVRRWVGRFGAERTARALEENNRPAPLVVRTNATRTTREKLLGSLKADGADAKETAYSAVGIELVSSPGLTTLSAFRDGWFMVQDEAAQLVATMLAPKPGETVLDACAAPGGKATHLAEMMGNSGQVVALEGDKKRIPRIRENAARLGLTIIKPVLGDAALYKEGAYDKVLVDAPCSGLGVLRRHPDGRWTKTVKTIKEKQVIQKKVLANCAALVNPGGVLVYATCTTEPEENENVVNDFLAKHPEFSLDDPRQYLPASASKLNDVQGFFRTFPNATEMDGFFGARMRRK